MADNGSFIISWQSHHLGSDPWQIMAQQYGAQTFGTSGRDVIRDKAGVDNLYGLGGNDKMYGESGNDALKGGQGNDFLNGGAGNDFFYGGKGNDRLKGGAVADSFDFKSLKNEGRDVIVDFTDSHDTIRLPGGRFEQIEIDAQGSNTLITLKGGTEILLKDVTSDLISAGDFYFF